MNSRTIVLIAVAFIFGFAILVINRIGENLINGNRSVLSTPASGEYVTALRVVEEAEGSLEFQKECLQSLEDGLKTKKVESSQLGRRGDWLHHLRCHIAVREAKQDWSYVQSSVYKAQSLGLSDCEITTAVKCIKSIGHWVDTDYATSEKLGVSHADLYYAKYKVTHHGQNPPG